MTTQTTKTIRVRTSEGVVFVPVERSVFHIDTLESDFGEVVGCIMSPTWRCADCFASWARRHVRVHFSGPNIYATSIEALTTETDADYFTYCDFCGHKLDLRYTPNASDGERRHAPTRSSWTDP